MGQNSFSSFLLFLVVYVVVLGDEKAARVPRKCSVVVILGAGGDLVKRFVWKSLWSTFSVEEPFAVVATSRGDVSQLVTNLNSGLHCSSGAKECNRLEDSWKRCTAPARLKHNADYELLGSVIPQLTEECGCKESQRVYYLAVPPSAYVSLAGQIHTLARPPPDAELVVAFEKPFGRDLSSSLALAEGLKHWLKEEEVFRVDHYLAKEAVQLILRFRCENRQILSKLFSGEHIVRMDLAAKESLTAQGRTGYYDQYGVIRDMMQNHLTQVLTLAAMEIPSDCSDAALIESSKVGFLKMLPKASSSKTLLGQYSTYSQEVETEGGRNGSLTPTFAVSILEPSFSHWKGTKFVLSSGKGFPLKSTYVQILFSSTDTSCPREILFLISDPTFTPSIIVSHHFRDLMLNGLLPTGLPSNTVPFLSSMCWYGIFPCIDCNREAYDVIAESLLNQKRSMFVSTEVLLESWRIWSDLVTEVDLKPIIPLVYSSSTLHKLDFSPWSTLHKSFLN